MTVQGDVSIRERVKLPPPALIVESCLGPSHTAVLQAALDPPQNIRRRGVTGGPAPDTMLAERRTTLGADSAEVTRAFAGILSQPAPLASPRPARDELRHG